MGLSGVRADVAALRLGFVPQEAVRWFAPAQLQRTAVKVGLSLVLAGYEDKRELQASFPTGPVDLDLDGAPGGPVGPGGLWLDFTADTGDGFDATFSVASLLAQEKLAVHDDVAGDLLLPRGHLLVFGGDEVYPTPSALAYQDRLKGPFRAAFPEPADAADRREGPLMLALPGNHDWYDGLTAFLRTFAQHRRIGGWRTRQTRSYWVARLREDWWLVGLDSQFGGEIDEPQLAYFREHLSRHLRPGHSVIMCVASPTWITAAERSASAFDSFHYFDRNYVRRYRPDNSEPGTPTGAQVRLWITGDRHHYARYEEQSGALPPRHLLTCGLGGAYLNGTHHLPPVLHLPPDDSPLRGREEDAGAHEDAAPFRLRVASPTPAASRRARWGLLSISPRGLPWRNPGFVPVIGGAHVVLFVVLSLLLGIQRRSGPMTAVMTAGIGSVLQLFARTAVVVAVVLVVWFVARRVHRVRHRDVRERRREPSFWARAGSAQLALACLSLGAATEAASRLAGHLPWPGDDTAPGWVFYGAWLLVSLVPVGVVASWVIALSLAVTTDPSAFDWQDSAQAIEEHKGFVRMHLSAAGDLTLYPLLAERVCHDWSVRDGRLVPTAGLPALRLIEPPVVIPALPVP